MVDIPLLRKRAAELAEGRLSRDGAAICLNAALDEIEELRGEIASLRAEIERNRFVLDQMDGDAMEANHDIMELRTVLSELVTLKFDRPDDYEERKPKAWNEARRVLGINAEERAAELQGHELCRNGCCCRHCDTPTNDLTTTPCPRRLIGETTCPDCGIGPYQSDPTSVTAATPRCYQRGYCGEPGEMSRPQVSALVDGQPYPLWDAVQMRGDRGSRGAGMDIRSHINDVRELRQRTHEAKGGKVG